jgi:DNA-binding MarR family transcriptional regulator
MNFSMSRLTRTNLGFLLAKALQRWNSVLYARFCDEGFSQIRPAFGAILVPLFEEDGLRLGELASRAKLSKQTMTTMVRLVEKANLVVTRPDPEDGRAKRVYLTKVARRFEPTAEKVLAELERRAINVEGRVRLEQVRSWLEGFTSKALA